MNPSVRDFYLQNISQLELSINACRKRLTLFYVARSLTFLGFAVLLVLFFLSSHNYLWLSCSIVSFILFLACVKLDLKKDSELKLLTNKLLINQNELRSIDHEYSNRLEGDEFSVLNPHLANDFDLFGQGSLFQYLNRCSTGKGRERFAKLLVNAELNNDIIVKRQKLIKELSAKTEFINNFQAQGLFISENGKEIDHLLIWISQTEEKTKFIKLWNVVVPIITVTWFAFVCFGLLGLLSMLIPLAISASILSYNGKRIKKAHALLGKSAKTFEMYSTLLKLIENEKFESEGLFEIQQKLNNNGRQASQSLKRLFKLLNYFDVRYNVVVSLFLNGFFVFDLQILLRLNKWKLQHSEAVQAWFQSLAEIDAAIGFATYAYNNAEYISYPMLSDKSFEFNAELLGHPLIHPAIRVCNNISFAEKPSLLIVTGANMAGKSTFLRTLSANLILAMNGAPVCAKTFYFTPCNIMSSIKIQDSLANQQSYFYAELLRLKEIITFVQSNPATIVILDEILRGTNTKDKQLGSIGILEKLHSLGCVVVIATHDLLIGELEKKYPETARNYCFEVELQNDQLLFDYTLKHGISQKLNASFLMKKMEIIS